MPLLEDFLLRFRRVWAPPGPVTGQAGVPEDAVARRDAELREVAAALTAIEHEGEDIVRAAEAQATAITEAARAESMRLVETARGQAPEQRAQAAAARVRDREAGMDTLIAAADREADEIRDRARSRMQPLVDRIVAEVLAPASSAEVSHGRVVGGG